MTRLGAALILTLGLVVGIVALVKLGGHDHEARFDWIVTELVEKGHHREAVDELESLRDRAGPDLADRINHQLARACAGVGDDPALSHEQRIQWYRRAFELDPDALDPLARATVQRHLERSQ